MKAQRGGPDAIRQHPRRQGPAAASAAEREKVYTWLVGELVEGRLAAGARLTEASLAARMGVSRTPVREALLRLEQDGFVRSELHRGFRVAPLDAQTARDIYPIVASLEGLALRLSASILAMDVGRLRRANEVLYAARTDSRAAMDADAAFHRLLIARCANPSLIQLLERLKRQLERYECIYMSEEPLIDLSVRQHEAIIRAIERNDVTAAAVAVADNYESGLALVLSKLRGRAGEEAA